MGSAACAAVEGADDLELVARLGSADPLPLLTDAEAEVAVDLTRPDAVMDNLRFCIENGIHTVVGTSGFDDERLATLRSLLADAPGVGVLVAPNFAVGAVLSGLAGYIGMTVAVRANVRVAEEARHGLARAFALGSKGGAVTGFFVVGLAALIVGIIAFQI